MDNFKLSFFFSFKDIGKRVKILKSSYKTGVESRYEITLGSKNKPKLHGSGLFFLENFGA